MNTNKSTIPVSEICLAEFHRPDIKFPSFSELIGALATAFSDLGIHVSYRENSIEQNSINLVFGYHRLFQVQEQQINRLPENCIIFNLEQLIANTQIASHAKYIDFLKNFRVIDYSAKNHDLLAHFRNDRVYRFKFGYIPLTPFRFLTNTKSGKLLFYGAPSDRRKFIVDSLYRKNVPVKGIVNYWGVERDIEICSSKAVLNINKFDYSILEIYRLWHSLCLGTPVISEKGIDQKLYEEWEKYVFFIDNVDQLYDASKINPPSPSLYKNETSFLTNSAGLLEWINTV